MMSVTPVIILVAVNTVILFATCAGTKSKTNFERCMENYSVRNTSCDGSLVHPILNRCANKTNVQFYCASSSPMQVIIGQLNYTSQPDTIFLGTLSIESFVISKNGSHSYCINIAAKVSADYFVQCHTNAINPPKWVPFNVSTLHEDSVHALKYTDVKKTDPKGFCKLEGPFQSKRLPVLLPCDTWHMCAIVLANRYKNASNINAKMFDLSMIDDKTIKCSNKWKLRETLRNGSEQFSKPGLLAFRYYQNEYLLPYSTVLYKTGTLMAFNLRTYPLPSVTKFIVECQSSVLHSCGLEIVASNVRIENSDVDCHRYFMTVKLLPGLNSTITCKAFNEFEGAWDSATEYVANSNTKTSNEEEPNETTDNSGNNNNTSASSDGDGQLVFIIVGAVLGGIFLCFLILLPLLIHLYKRINRQQQKIRLTEEEICEFMEGMQLEKAKSRGVHNVFVLPYDRSLEVSKIAVDFKTTILGSGAFGKVLKGRYKGQDVAIKTIDGTTLNADAFRSLLTELKIMSYLGKHEHVMELVGAITSDIKTGEVFLILEYCGHGSAVNYIREHREDFVSFLSDDKTTYTQNSSAAIIDSGSELSSHHLVRWSYEVACGMEYVSSQNIYHGDLAARNILLTENLTIKVGDFGLSKQLDKEKYACYVQKKECPLPLKWMAIESLRDLKFSIQSDVWSFGVTLWEFFSLGTIPYPGMEWNLESWKSLSEGVRLDRPEFASMRIYNNIMLKCWLDDPKDRPTFSALRALLKNELDGFNSVETCKVTTLRQKYEKATNITNPNNVVI